MPNVAVAAEKVGAGLLLCCDNEVLLLRRSPTSKNPLKWGLPGGNADAMDADLLHTASREALEEMGNVPDFTLDSAVLTKRGKRGQKHYTVYVARVAREAARAFVPHLNREHVEWRWFDARALPADLHPVLQVLRDQHARELSASLQFA